MPSSDFPETKTDCCSVVFAFDPTDGDSYNIPAGKQTLKPSHIFYRPCSGIWQSVWIESAPKNHITDLDVNGDANGQVTLTVSTTGRKSSNVEITVYERVSTWSYAERNMRPTDMITREPTNQSLHTAVLLGYLSYSKSILRRPGPPTRRISTTSRLKWVKMWSEVILDSERCQKRMSMECSELCW